MINDLPLIFSFLILVDWINKYWWTLTMYFLFSIHKSWEVSNSFLLEHFTTSFSYESFSTNSKASMILRRSEDVRIRYLVALSIRKTIQVNTSFIWPNIRLNDLLCSFALFARESPFVSEILVETSAVLFPFLFFFFFSFFPLSLSSV